MSLLAWIIVSVGSIMAFAIAFYFLIRIVVDGPEKFFPFEMRYFYRQTRIKFARAGWGRYPDTGESGEAYDVEYPNRKENS